MFTDGVSATRLFALAALTRGPSHGHEIRRQAQIDRTELWTDVKPGSLYGALHRLATDGAIEVVRTEQSGGPARTVYAITDAGRREFEAERDRILSDVRLRPDPVDLALQHVEDLEMPEVVAILTARRAAYVAQLTQWRELYDSARPFLRDLEPMAFRHAMRRLDAEISWHDEVIAELPKLRARSGKGQAARDQ